MPISVDFLPVGDSNGDAIIIKYGQGESFYLQIVDGGYAKVGEEMIEHLEKHYGKDLIIADMVVSHADNDHAKGLIPVFKHFKVANLWMNRPWLYAQEVLDQFHGNWSLEGWIKEVRDSHEYLVELEELARARGMEPKEVFRGAQIGPFHILAPSKDRYITLIPDLDKTPPPYKSETAGLGRGLFELARNVLDAIKETMDVETLDANPPATSASNETSVVQLGLYDNKKILLTADVGPAGLTEAALYAHSCGFLSAPDMIQIPHQGSRRNVTPAVLNAWLGEPNGGKTSRGAALVMVGKNKKEWPRKKVKNAFIRRGYPVYVGRSESAMHMPYGYAKRGTDMTAEPFSHDVEDD
jgi:beta-lactamase superfamily II metal-dependent hydrolase